MRWLFLVLCLALLVHSYSHRRTGEAVASFILLMLWVAAELIWR